MIKGRRSQSPQSHSQSIITPPDSFIDSSLPSSTSPPATNPNLPKRNIQISDIINLLRRRRSGHAHSVAPWLVFPLPFADFEILLTEIKADETLWGYFQDKVRYDYSSRWNLFILRMHTTIHEFIIAHITIEILKQLDNIAPAAGITHLGSPSLDLPAEDTDDEDGFGNAHGPNSVRNSPETGMPAAKHDKHDPDAEYGHPQDSYPGVVLEVAYSQKMKAMNYIAEEYILGSHGNIRAVIALDLDYHRSKRVTLSVWRPEIVKDEDGSERLVCELKVDGKPFRTKQGRPVKAANAGLELQLRDFSTTTRTADISTSNRIYISPQSLCDIVTQAENSKIGKTSLGGRTFPLAPGIRTRKRVRTPPEQLASDDEHKFAQEEESEVKRVEMEDDDYEDSSLRDV